MAKLGILTVHGMGTPLIDFDNELESGLLKRLNPDFKHSVVFESIFYDSELHSNATKLWQRLDGEGLRWDFIRKTFIFGFADATAFHVKAEDDKGMYFKINEIILSSIEALNQKLDTGAPVVIIAQSLGCQVISNYIWDAQRNQGIWHPGTRIPLSYQKLENAKLLITTGCNIPLFISGLHVEKLEAIHPLNNEFKWFNSDDVLGYPLKPLSTGFDNSYNNVVTEDIKLNTGFTPIVAHTNYWRNPKCLDSMANKINQL